MQDVILVRLEALGRRAKITGGTKFKWKHLIGKVDEGRRRALKIAGMEVRRSTQRAMSNPKPKREKLIDIGTFNGERLIVREERPSKPDKVSSWKTPRNPKGFLRSDIQYDYDFSTDSVVVGPAKLPKLNKLHEIGGEVKLWFIRTGPPQKVPRKFAKGTVFGIRSNTPGGNDPIDIGPRRVRARGFMRKGLKGAEPKIPDAFRNCIVGP